jgi:hypothetical protein
MLKGLGTGLRMVQTHWWNAAENCVGSFATEFDLGVPMACRVGSAVVLPKTCTTTTLHILKEGRVSTNEAAPEPARPVIRPCRPSVHPSGRLLHIVKEQ